jgi:Grap2 and cyclin-D-interacting
MASSSSATLSCLKQFHEPILPLVSEFQAISSRAYPEYFTKTVQQRLLSLFDTMVQFLQEIVEIVCGDSNAESQERLHCSALMIQECDRIQKLCKEGPVMLLRSKLEETEEMLKDALDELGEVIEPATSENYDDDGWNGGPGDYTPEQTQFATRTQRKLRLLSMLYKAISKRRITAKTAYVNLMAQGLDSIDGCLKKLEALVDDLVSGVSMAEEPMTLELSLVQLVDEAKMLSGAVRLPLDGVGDGQVDWFVMWSKKIAES